MKKLLTALAILVAPIALCASPAATQQWVKNYVASMPTGEVDKQWVINYIRTGIVATASVEISDAERAESNLTLALYAADRSGLHALTFSYDWTNGTHAVKMADAPSGNGWTNVVYGCGVQTNAQYVATMTVNATNYVCSTFSNYTHRNVFTYTNGATTNDIVVWYASITTNDWKTARGEN